MLMESEDFRYKCIGNRTKSTQEASGNFPPIQSTYQECITKTLKKFLYAQKHLHHIETYPVVFSADKLVLPFQVIKRQKEGFFPSVLKTQVEFISFLTKQYL